MKPNIDLSLMLVTDPAMTGRRGLIETVLAAVEGGVTIVQLRDKHADDAALTETANALRDALALHGVPLIVNDRSMIARAAALCGVHIGQDDGHPEKARALLGPRALIGLSVTRAEDVATVDAAVVDYVGLGPVIASATKTDAAPPMGFAGLKEIGAALPVPFVAIGGITADTAGAAIHAGAAGVAVVSAICAADDPCAAARRIRDAVEAAR